MGKLKEEGISEALTQAFVDECMKRSNNNRGESCFTLPVVEPFQSLLFLKRVTPHKKREGKFWFIFVFVVPKS